MWIPSGAPKGISRQVKSDKAKRPHEPGDLEKEQDESTNAESIDDDILLDNPADVNTIPDIAPFKPERPSEKTRMSVSWKTPNWYKWAIPAAHSSL